MLERLIPILEKVAVCARKMPSTLHEQILQCVSRALPLFRRRLSSMNDLRNAHIQRHVHTNQTNEKEQNFYRCRIIMLYKGRIIESNNNKKMKMVPCKNSARSPLPTFHTNTWSTSIATTTGPDCFWKILSGSFRKCCC